MANYFNEIIRSGIQISTLQNSVSFSHLFLSRNLTVFQPDSYNKILWDSLVVLLIILNIFYIPMKLAFSLNINSNLFTSYFLDDLPSWVFLLEIVFNFNTAFYD
jgi:hypothetical protein